MWSRGMIPASGAGGPEFDSRHGPESFLGSFIVVPFHAVAKDKKVGRQLCIAKIFFVREFPRGVAHTVCHLYVFF